MTSENITHKPAVLVESHPVGYSGYPFITMVQIAHTTNIPSIIDNSTNASINLYALDQCVACGIELDTILEAAVNWYENNAHMPFSIELSLRGLSEYAGGIMRCYRMSSITRIIGPLANYPYSASAPLKRRKAMGIVPRINYTNHTTTP